MTTFSTGSLLRRHSPLADPREQVQLLAKSEFIPEFSDHLERKGLPELSAAGIEVLQVNVGKVCNQTCHHCHVDAGPDRTESMTKATAEACLRVLEREKIPKFDITGGAPELNPYFRWMVTEATRIGAHVMDRCNLTVLQVAGQEDLARFLARNKVEVICSLPYYQERETDRQRGNGVFQRSIDSLRVLNGLGYGRADSGLILNLIHNPVGAFLPPAQKAMEAEFRRHLAKDFAVEFNNLYCITNMPISRYLEFLISTGNYEAYLTRLVNAFNPAAVAGVMCRTMVSVGWDGRLYDCDFNQMLDLGTTPGMPRTIEDFDGSKLRERRIVTGRHCFGCTAGAGSSCGGEIA